LFFVFIVATFETFEGEILVPQYTKNFSSNATKDAGNIFSEDAKGFF